MQSIISFSFIINLSKEFKQFSLQPSKIIIFVLFNFMIKKYKFIL